MGVSGKKMPLSDFYNKIQYYADAYYIMREQYKSASKYLETIPEYFREDVRMSIELANVEAKLVEKMSKYKSYF